MRRTILSTPGLQEHVNARRVGMAGDVGQALLCDAIDGDFRLGRKGGEIIGERSTNVDAALVGERARQFRQGAREPKLLEHLRPKITGDPPHLVQRPAHGLLRLFDLEAVLRLRAGQGVELEQHPGQRLSDFVVQAAGDPQPLRLLSLPPAVRRGPRPAPLANPGGPRAHRPARLPHGPPRNRSNRRQRFRPSSSSSSSISLVHLTTSLVAASTDDDPGQAVSRLCRSPNPADR
jgi:hypothetical protein